MPWIIASIDVEPETHERLYWNEEIGWADRTLADEFNTHDVRRYDVPMGGIWQWEEPMEHDDGTLRSEAGQEGQSLVSDGERSDPAACAGDAPASGREGSSGETARARGIEGVV